MGNKERKEDEIGNNKRKEEKVGNREERSLQGEDSGVESEIEK